MSDLPARLHADEEIEFQETLCRRVMAYDPFASDRVSDPSEGAIDVTEIHQRAFNRLTRLAKQSLSQGRGVGVVLWGEPGIGKSHLLARFSRWAQTDQRGYYFFLHNLQVSPERFPRYVLKCILHQMAMTADGMMFGGPLYTLMNRIAHMALVRFKRDLHSERTPAVIREDVMRFLQARGVIERVDDKDIYSVFIEFFLSLLKIRQRHNGVAVPQVAVDWLSGDELTEHDARQLAMLTHSSAIKATLPDDEAVCRVLLALSNLAKLTGRSFTLCFDQVENLGDSQMHTLAKFTHGMIDHAHNLLVVTSGVQRDLIEYKHDVIRASSWDRIAQHEISLTRIDTNLSKQLLTARLKPFFRHDSLSFSKEHEIQKDQLFPLGTEWYDRRMSNLVEVRPRDVIAWARHRWSESRDAIFQQGSDAWFQELKVEFQEFVANGERDDRRSDNSPAMADFQRNHHWIDEAVGDRLAQYLEGEQNSSDSVPPADIADVVESLLQQCLNAAWSYELVDIDHPNGRGNQQPPYRFVARTRNAHGEKTIGFAFLFTDIKTKASGVLRRIAGDKKRPDRVLLATDARSSMQIGDRGRRHLIRIENDGDTLNYEVSADEYEQLQAMAAVISDARSGSLETTDGERPNERIEPSEVIASFHRSDQYRQVDFLASVLGERTVNPSRPAAKAPAAIPTPALSQATLRRFIMARLALAGWMSNQELATEFVRDHGFQDEWSVETIRPLLEATAEGLQKEGKVMLSDTGVQLTLELANV